MIKIPHELLMQGPKAKWCIHRAQSFVLYNGIDREVIELIPAGYLLSMMTMEPAAAMIDRTSFDNGESCMTVIVKFGEKKDPNGRWAMWVVQWKREAYDNDPETKSAVIAAKEHLIDYVKRAVGNDARLLETVQKFN